MVSAKIERDEWNRRVLSYGGSFLQSWEWGDLQRSIGKKIHRFSGEGYLATSIEQPLPRGFSYRYFPQGPLFEDAYNTHVWQQFLRNTKALRFEK